MRLKAERLVESLLEKQLNLYTSCPPCHQHATALHANGSCPWCTSRGLGVYFLVL